MTALESSTGFSINFDEQFRSPIGSGSVILSQQSSRFWIPFDVKMFESLTPKDYLEKYCKVNNRRFMLYKRIFDKYKNNEGDLLLKSLNDALADTYMKTIDTTFLNKIIQLLELPSNTRLNFQQYQGIAAFSERFLFNIFSRPDMNEPQLQKDVLEKLDFSSLKWKLVGVNISPTLLQVLRYL